MAFTVFLVPKLQLGNERRNREIINLSELIDTIDLKNRVIHALQHEVGPALQLDGSGIEVVDVTGGIVQVRLHDVCTGCPSTIMTVIMGIEQELRRLVPEVEYLEAVL